MKHPWGLKRNPRTTANQFLSENPWQNPCRQQQSQLPSVVYMSSPVFCFQCQLTAIPYCQPRRTISSAHSLHDMAHSYACEVSCSFPAGADVWTSLFREENTLQPWATGPLLDPVFISLQGFALVILKWLLALQRKIKRNTEIIFWKLLVIQTYVLQSTSSLLHLLLYSVPCRLKVRKASSGKSMPSRNLSNSLQSPQTDFTDRRSSLEQTGGCCPFSPSVCYV